MPGSLQVRFRSNVPTRDSTPSRRHGAGLVGAPPRRGRFMPGCLAVSLQSPAGSHPKQCPNTGSRLTHATGDPMDCSNSLWTLTTHTSLCYRPPPQYMSVKHVPLPAGDWLRQMGGGVLSRGDGVDHETSLRPLLDPVSWSFWKDRPSLDVGRLRNI